MSESPELRIGKAAKLAGTTPRRGMPAQRFLRNRTTMSMRAIS